MIRRADAGYAGPTISTSKRSAVFCVAPHARVSGINASGIGFGPFGISGKLPYFEPEDSDGAVRRL
jgi:hypothetical protein